MPRFERTVAIALLIGAVVAAGSTHARAEVTREQVEKAIRHGIAFLQERQEKDGSWPGQPGTTALAALALMTAGEPATEPHVAKALKQIGEKSPDQLDSTYAVALQMMAFAAADPARYERKIALGVEWLERAQIRDARAMGLNRGQPRRGPVASGLGSWDYKMQHPPMGDNSNSQYAVLGLNAGREAGIRIEPEVIMLARRYWEDCQLADGGWGYKPTRGQPTTGSMTCAGISSLILTGVRRYLSHEVLVAEQVEHCGEGEFDMRLQRGFDWLGAHFHVDQNPQSGAQWKHYYLYGLERAGRLSGLRFFGGHDWYREGAEELVKEQERISGGWTGGQDNGPIVSTSFALLFLAKGRAPVLVNKLRHGPGPRDWDNDPDDIRNLVDLISQDWKHLLTWQVVDPATATVEDLLQAPIVYFNGHEAPVFTPQAKQTLKEFVEQGGFIFAEACCHRRAFDEGFRALMKELFPEPEYELHLLPEEHPVWRSKYQLSPEVSPLFGIEHGCRTVVIYSPHDLSCYWGQMEIQPANPAVIKAQRVGQNVVDYVTGREMPADKLDPREVTRMKVEPARRGALQIAKLRHAGDWNVAPLAIPNLTTALRSPPLNFDVVINHREIFPSDPNLINFPLLYIHGRGALSFSEQDRNYLRKHLEPGGGTIFADAACGSAAFDASFRKFAAELLPDNPFVPIPTDDDIYTNRVGYDLSEVQYSKAAGGQRGLPQLEGVKLNGHWAIIYSKFDIGCALEHDQSSTCKGYTHESALKIAANIVVYSTLP
ncbi:MAG TPA: DUF4159 domain-containing protein [Isosphaeraceae bacterium]|jgi:hypothetical protein|nr:DUF4159 domain-containing protein [Isosphaeraceae bacterium]